jgi:hypothetical protein
VPPSHVTFARDEALAPSHPSQVTGAAARWPGSRTTYPGSSSSRVIQVGTGSGLPSSPSGLISGLPGSRHARLPVFSAITCPRSPSPSCSQRTVTDTSPDPHAGSSSPGKRLVASPWWPGLIRMPPCRSRSSPAEDKHREPGAPRAYPPLGVPVGSFPANAVAAHNRHFWNVRSVPWKRYRQPPGTDILGFSRLVAARLRRSIGLHKRDILS